MINFSECKKVIDEIRLNGMYLDILKNNGFNIDNIVKIDYSKNAVESDVYLFKQKIKLNMLEFTIIKLNFAIN